MTKRSHDKYDELWKYLPLWCFLRCLPYVCNFAANKTFMFSFITDVLSYVLQIGRQKMLKLENSVVLQVFCGN